VRANITVDPNTIQRKWLGWSEPIAGMGSQLVMFPVGLRAPFRKARIAIAAENWYLILILGCLPPFT
jgi:hypothetical protein